MKITFKDGSIREYDKGTTALLIAKDISNKLYKEALVAKVNGESYDLNRPIEEDAKLEIFTFEDAEGKWALRHTASHIMAQALKRLYKDIKLAIGPAIDTGFYYDFDLNVSLSAEDFGKIEKEMEKIVNEDYALERFVLPKAEAIKLMQDANEPYKVELIEALPDSEEISFYKQGEFVDLCAGPHVVSTGKVKSLKLLSIAGAYWRGDEKNKMLQRIYGTAYTKKADLEEYLNMLEEAKRRDHRKLGKDLDLFMVSDEGPGFPFFLPKGMVLRNTLEDFWRGEHKKAGYDEIKTPMILNKNLWIQSGHWDHYKDNMYFTKIDDEDYCIKPMNCPGGMLAYKRKIYSYRDFPLRVAELGLVHRHELSGALHGLMRVRCFTQDDAHIFMTEEQITDEIVGVINLVQYIYGVFGFDYFVELSTRPENSMGTDEDWEMTTNALITALDAKGLPYRVNEGDGAFYGPKIDFHLRDSLGRTWQCGTIQLDCQMPEKFDLTYVGKDGQKHRPLMLHRTIFGSIERFIGILTEHFAGNFPLWLAPVQVKVMALTERANDKVYEVAKELENMGIRTEKDIRNEKIGFKIREAQMEKIPYMVIIGDKEIENGVISVRSIKKGDLGTMELNAFVADIKNEIDTKAN